MIYPTRESLVYMSLQPSIYVLFSVSLRFALCSQYVAKSPSISETTASDWLLCDKVEAHSEWVTHLHSHEALICIFPFGSKWLVMSTNSLSRDLSEPLSVNVYSLTSMYSVYYPAPLYVAIDRDLFDSYIDAEVMIYLSKLMDSNLSLSCSALRLRKTIGLEGSVVADMIKASSKERAELAGLNLATFRFSKPTPDRHYYQMEWTLSMRRINQSRFH